MTGARAGALIRALQKPHPAPVGGAAFIGTDDWADGLLWFAYG